MMRMKNNLVFIVMLFFGAIFSLGNTEPIQDKKLLLEFIENIPHSPFINWDINTSACSNWTGVTCNHNRTSVIAVRLPALSLEGSLPLNTLSRLSNLQILSLRSNGLSGLFPSDFYNLKNLTSLHLQCNGFYGPLPTNLSFWNNLSVLNLSHNRFNGSIDPSISSLTHLTVLSLANNSLSGEIPDFSSASLQVLDLSNNNFTGTVPQSLMRFPSSAFLGNNLVPQGLMLPTVSYYSSGASKKSKLGHSAILGIVIGSCVFVLGLLTLLMVFWVSKKEGRKQNVQRSVRKEKKVKGIEKLKSTSENGNENGNGSLVFFEGSSLAFNLEDLLRASAEVLGKGTFGITYKAALEESSAVVVKRLLGINVTRREFEQQMEIVGKTVHENVVPLRAYYYSKDEKLMVYDYFNQGSVSSMLHANRGADRTPLDWDSRLRIAIGAARGITHIHTQDSRKLVHGNIKASNTFLNQQHYGCVSDLGLAAIMNPTLAQVMKSGGYQAPEIADTKKVYQASDVYSFGVLLLELLTGKSPTHATCSNDTVHLVRWVQSVVQEEWTAEVFDVELLRYPNIEEEMVEMLQIGMQCVAKSPEQRPKMAEVVTLMESIRADEQRLL
uniref:probable inactive receptor kinase At4g23740 n=1 Tax=Erigeron canadensis TaxID=72917 RepID=UPI001CB9A067|nr:probable inactive receptor kinase At4g23740 [Erigeron canadensis]